MVSISLFMMSQGSRNISQGWMNFKLKSASVLSCIKLHYTYMTNAKGHGTNVLYSLDLDSQAKSCVETQTFGTRTNLYVKKRKKISKMIKSNIPHRKPTWATFKEWPFVHGLSWVSASRHTERKKSCLEIIFFHCFRHF